MVISDQMRGQPWVYFYVLVLLPFIITKNEKSITNYLRILLVGIYLWSGLHKFNSNFQNFIFESMLVDGFGITNSEILFQLKSFAFTIPLIEIGFAILLLFQKTRKIGVLLGISSHIFILYYLIFGLQGNWVVVPWNIFLIFSLLYLFYFRKENMKFPSSKSLSTILSIVLLLPVGFLFEKVDQRLAFSLYDGKIKSLYQLNSGSDTHYEIHQELLSEGSIMDYNLWSYNELHVPFYPEKRFIKQIKKQRKSNFVLLITDFPLWPRVLKGHYKTEEELKNYQKVDSLELIKFNSSVLFPNYMLVK